MSGEQRNKSGSTRPERESGELPSRAALVARLEVQRAELLRAMLCVNLARRSLEEHLGQPSLGTARLADNGLHPDDRQYSLEAVNAAGEALGSAYPMLERIAEALDVEEILKAHGAGAESPRPESLASSQRNPRYAKTHAR